MREREIIAKEWRDENGILHRREVGPELVRCKDCKHYAEHNELYINAPTNCVKHSTINHYVAVKANDFCSYGERKESEVIIPEEVRKEHMAICNKCKERKAVAKMVDFHVDWLDCFWDCPNDYEHWIKAKEGE